MDDSAESSRTVQGPRKAGYRLIPVATNQNVLITVDRLRRQFRSQVNAGTLLVAGGVYDLGTQLVTVLTYTVGATRGSDSAAR